jgi:IMP dehydrogenase/GMP reductase
MLKTRITEQYGLKVPFINAGMAFIATAPLVRAMCKAGGLGMLGSPAMPPDVLQAAIREIKAVDPACLWGRCHCTVQRDRAHRGVRHGEGTGCSVLLG